MAETPMPDFDAIIIGAGMSGMYQLHLLRGLGMKVRVFEAGSDVGGTWYWNRYPGCRFDSESYSYGFSFSKEVLAEWDWTEHFSPQPETLRYLQFIADKFDLRRDMTFNSRVRAAVWNEAVRAWTVTLEDGSSATARFLITAVGPLSAPVMPRIAGVEDFKGEAHHTARWPKTPVSFEGKRVAIIGTGATGVQTIQEVAKTCGTLTVFQRTPNWCAPLHNARIGKEEMAQIRARYDEIFHRCQQTFGCFLHTADPRHTFDVSAEAREAFWEELYASPGFGIWVGNFMDMLTNREANAAMSDFVARKIRARVHDPVVAEKLIPKNHGFGTRRVPLETKYYEVYNQPNVRLIDINETPIERITEHGIRTSAEDLAFDMIIYATGFDALTGSFDRIDIQGVDGQRLREAWKDGPRSFVGMQVVGFPNMLMLLGPHTALGNIPRSIEYNVEWVADFLKHLRAHGVTRAEPTTQAQAEWLEVVKASAEGLLSNEVSSWFTGVNTNIEGKGQRILARYSGSAPEYRKRCDAIAAGGYREILRA